MPPAVHTRDVCTVGILSPSASSDHQQAQPDPFDGPLAPAALANPAALERRPRTFIAALATLAATACAVLAFALYQAAVVDPYTQAVLALDGDPGQGGRLFRINCAGCHGLAAQGWWGPISMGWRIVKTTSSWCGRW